MTPRQGTRVRRAGPEDAALLGGLNAIVQQVHHEALPDRFKSPDAAAAGVFFAAQLVRPEVVAFVAEQDGEALGYALAEELRGQETAFTFARSTLYLHHLAVLDTARQRGVGRLLMATVDEEARRRGAEEVRLDYWLFNSAAKRFFGDLGYVPYSERARRPVDLGLSGQQ